MVDDSIVPGDPYGGELPPGGLPADYPLDEGGIPTDGGGW